MGEEQKRRYPGQNKEMKKERHIQTQKIMRHGILKAQVTHGEKPQRWKKEKWEFSKAEGRLQVCDLGAGCQQNGGRGQPPALLGAPHPFQAAPLPGWALLKAPRFPPHYALQSAGVTASRACSAGLPRKDATLPAGVPSSLRLNHFHNYRNSMDASSHVQTQKYDPVFYTWEFSVPVEALADESYFL